jgi:hypothetical protein
VGRGALPFPLLSVTLFLSTCAATGILMRLSRQGLGRCSHVTAGPPTTRARWSQGLPPSPHGSTPQGLSLGSQGQEVGTSPEQPTVLDGLQPTPGYWDTCRMGGAHGWG